MKYWLLVVGSALLYLAAFPPLNAGFMVMVALVPWLMALKDCTKKQVGWGGFLWGFIVMGGNMIWIPRLVTQWTGSGSLGWIPWLICCAIGGAYFTFMAHIMRRALEKNWLWAIPLLWVGFEIARSQIPGVAFPYFLIATPLWPYPYMIQTAHVGTIYLVSAWVAAVNILFFAWLNKLSFRPLRPVVMAVLMLFFLSVVQFMSPIEAKTQLIAAGQPGVNMAFPDESTPQKLYGAMEKVNFDARQGNVAALILPEGMCQSDSSGVPQPPFQLDPQIPTLLGGHRMEKDGEKITRYQSAFAADNGKFTHVDKARLVVFGEYVPGRGIIPFLDKFNLSDNDLTPGEATKAIKVGDIQVGPLICFESLFWDVAHKQSENGAQLLAIMSLDDWYMGTPAPDQLKAAAIWRAVETGLPVVRAATTGYSLGVDQRGKVVDELPIGATQALILRVAIEDKPRKMPQRAIFPWAFGLSLPILVVALYWKLRDG